MKSAIIRSAPAEEPVQIPRMRLDFSRHTCLEVERKGKNSRVITIVGEGLEMAWVRTDHMLRDHFLDPDNPLDCNILGLLRVNARSYLNNGDAVAKLTEALLMADTGTTELRSLSQVQLTEHYNKLASGTGRTAVKSFKSKGEAIKRIEALRAELALPSPEQAKNKTDMQATAAKRLSGLDRLKGDAEGEGETTTESGAAGSKKKEAKMAAKKVTATPKKSAAKKSAAKKSAAKKAAPKKVAGAEKKPRGQGIGAYCEELILKGKSNEETAEAARKKFGSNTTGSSVAWYRNKLKNEGKL